MRRSRRWFIISLREPSPSFGTYAAEQYGYNYAILDVTILTSSNGYNGTRCPPSKLLHPESLSRPVESPQGESFVDRPTSNLSSEGSETMPGKSFGHERRGKKLRSRRLRSFSARCDQSFRRIRDEIYIYTYIYIRCSPKFVAPAFYYVFSW